MAITSLGLYGTSRTGHAAFADKAEQIAYVYRADHESRLAYQVMHASESAYRVESDSEMAYRLYHQSQSVSA